MMEHINESQLINMIRESINELLAFHGSNSNFDRFNHKKYLNTGFGSQSFGWGTYVSDDSVIARSYADNGKKNVTLTLDGDDITDEDVFMDSLSSNTDISHEEIYNLYRSLSKYNFNINVIIESLKLNMRAATTFVNNTPDTDRKDTYIRYAEKNKHVVDVLTNLMSSGRMKYGKTDNYLYEVEIPEDNGDNYLEWYERIPKEQMRRILLGFGRLPKKYLEKIAKHNYPFRTTFYGYAKHPAFNEIVDIITDKEDYSSFFASGFVTDEKTNIGGQVYRYLQSLFGSDKAVSLYLMNVCGFDGVKYETGTRWKRPDGASEDGHNYVIFDANKVKITGKETR